MRKIFAKIRALLASRMLWTALAVLFIFCMLIRTLYTMQVQNAEAYREKIFSDTEEEITAYGVRGNIYDRNGRPLAENITTKSLYYRADEARENLNDSIRSLLAVLAENGDQTAIEQTLPIDYDAYTGFYYVGRYANPQSTALLNFLAEIYGTKRDDLTAEQAGASAEQAYCQMRDDTFSIDDPSLSIEETLAVMRVRYAIFEARWNPEEPVLIARTISEETQVTVLEQNDEYEGFYVETSYTRYYPEREPFSHILGYVGQISEEELKSHPDSGYDAHDVIGKSGLEAAFESELRGKGGTTRITYSGRTGEKISEEMIVAAERGHDILLTIDADFQRTCYEILRLQIKELLLEKLTDAADEPTYTAIDVLCALLENGFFDIETIKESENSLAVRYTSLYNQEADRVLVDLKDLVLHSDQLIETYNEETMDYFDALMTYLRERNDLSSEYRNELDPNYMSYANGEMSAQDFLKYCYDKGFFALDEFGIAVTVSSEEGLTTIMDSVLPALRHEKSFEQLVFTRILRNEQISTLEFLQMCYELGFLDDQDGSFERYRDGRLSLMDLLRGKIENNEITPAEINLDPCSGSLIVTDCDTGEVRALVSYPSYDNNLYMNNGAYIAKTTNDKSSPMLFRALQERRAPGSTFKMCTASAALEEGCITIDTTIYDDYAYPNVHSAAKPTCWSEESHGYINIVQAIRDSCNYFFYDLGYRLCEPDPETGEFLDKVGLDKIAYYADTLGLSTPTGIELYETDPVVSTLDAIRSAIGQGTHAYSVANINRYTNTIANGGTVYDLFLVKRIQDKDGTVLSETEPKAVSTADVSKETLNIIKQGMRLVNTEFNVDVLGELEQLGVTTAGKTGTAEESLLRPEHSWYTGYTNYDDPDISVTANIPYGNGSDKAIPIFRDVVKAYYDLTD